MQRKSACVTWACSSGYSLNIPSSISIWPPGGPLDPTDPGPSLFPAHEISQLNDSGFFVDPVLRSHYGAERIRVHCDRGWVGAVSTDLESVYHGTNFGGVDRRDVRYSLSYCCPLQVYYTVPVCTFTFGAVRVDGSVIYF
jgi:hypothetical protein